MITASMKKILYEDVNMSTLVDRALIYFNKEVLPVSLYILVYVSMTYMQLRNNKDLFHI